MHRSHGLLAVVATVAIASVGLFGQESTSDLTYSENNWLFAGGDWSSSRYSTLTEISTETVDRLNGAWVTRLEGGGSSRSTPVVHEGVIYLTAGANIFALDGATGETVWRWQPGSSESESRMVPSWQGVGLGAGLVFVGLRSAEVAAFRQDTGELVWAEPVGSIPAEHGETVTTAPIYAGGKVFVGVANGDSGGQGRIVAVDAQTGEKAWTFFIVPRPGEFGHDTWPQDSDIWKLGGGGVWLNGTVDAELGIVYFATGNPAPMFGGELREGDNLFTAAILALDIETGERKWHYQVVRHDIWDADIATPMLLYETQIDGQTRKALAAMRADGYLFQLDRETGEPIVPIEDREVPQDPFLKTAPTQPFPLSESILPDCSFWRDQVPPPFELNCSSYTPPSLDQHAVVAPSVPIPMVRVTPMSFSPQTGYIYAQGRAHVGRARRIEDPWIADNRPGGYDRLTLPASTGILAAVDGRTGRIAWKQEFGGGRLGLSGPLTTAGNLMFWGSADGQVDAYDARTGERVWAFQTLETETRLRPGPAATYAVDGRQYVVIAMGPEIWSFALDGPVSPRSAPDSIDLEDLTRWVGPAPRPVDTIETAMLRDSCCAVGGERNAIDEYAFNPLRVRRSVGDRIRFVNNGTMPHTIVARDGSWATDTLAPGMFEYVTLEEPGTFLYHCTEHPWSIGEITVDP
jgi:quinohemoprotein ethanol dehydrogenase